MGVGDVWNRALVYFGIVEEEQYWDEEAFDAEEELDRGYRDRPNPNVRRLLKVQIEDAISSEEIFSTLMGELVEPRRAFIETNALGVRNLDV